MYIIKLEDGTVIQKSNSGKPYIYYREDARSGPVTVNKNSIRVGHYWPTKLDDGSMNFTKIVEIIKD